MREPLPTREQVNSDAPLRLSVAAALAYPDGYDDRERILAEPHGPADGDD